MKFNLNTAIFWSLMLGHAVPLGDSCSSHETKETDFICIVDSSTSGEHGQSSVLLHRSGIFWGAKMVKSERDDYTPGWSGELGPKRAKSFEQPRLHLAYLQTGGHKRDAYRLLHRNCFWNA